MTEDLQPPARLEQPTWKPSARRPVSHRITAVSTRPGAWRPANPHRDEDGDYFYIGGHRRVRDFTPGEALFWLVSAVAGVIGFLYIVGVL